MTLSESPRWTAFLDGKRLASGAPGCVVKAARKALDADPSPGPGAESRLSFFSDETGRPLDADLRGTPDEAAQRVEPQKSTKPGRPKLGVSPREVTLLPRHWDWLSVQPGGASAALRRLVEEARKDPRAEAKRAQAAAGNFMTAALGDAPNYEEASRALYAKDQARFLALTEAWPEDLRDHARRLAAPGFEA
ncbi:DUF2239 family protein [Neomegalonema sp.]|uniref:DUF2239 family protein n=1 Tax=Neomegalonema sp. TaxID=2039713 RepID=UPI0026026129|nr:DUF2239 family protein [Neomegalonema sp.]MDD2868780.1 DUF2239 family protein [Neomegalonema sp.]